MGLGDDFDADTDTDTDTDTELDDDARAQTPAGDEFDDKGLDLDYAESDEQQGIKPQPKAQEQQSQQPQQQQQPVQQDQQPAPIRYSVDAKGNIIDRKSGRVLAAAGPHADTFKELQRTRVTVQRTQHELDQTSGDLNKLLGIAKQQRDAIRAFTDAEKRVQTAGLNPVEVAEAAQFYAAVKSGGPGALDAIKGILTRAAKSGIDLASLGVGTGGLDVKTLVDAIRQEIAPVTGELSARTAAEREAAAAEASRRKALDDAATETLSFFEANPEALQYADVIERALKDPRSRGHSINEVWLMIQNELLKQGSAGASRPAGRSQPPQGRQRPAVDPNVQINRPAPLGHDQKQIINEILDHYGVQ